MRDFTFQMYRELVEKLKVCEYKFLTFEKFMTLKTLPSNTIVMRHDVDKKPQNALLMAQLEKDLSIKSSYYFRINKGCFDTEIIKKISDMRHEIGYHYEDLTRSRGNMKKAIKRFEKNLILLRKFVPVKTVCMHGSPMSKWDNRKLWEKHDYKSFNIVGEPYYDVDFKKVLYLTDTGRRWNGVKMSVRDRVHSGYAFNAKTTGDLIDCLNKGKFPKKVMINIHPERWNDHFSPWFRQLVFQNTKNIVKKVIAKKSGNA